MPSFHETADAQAAPEEVWKLLYDPARFPDWWAGVGNVETGRDGAYTMYPAGYPEFPMAQVLWTQREAQRVTVSCLVSDLRFQWHLESLQDGALTRITVDVDIPDAEARRLEDQRRTIRESLGTLAALASRG